MTTVQPIRIARAPRPEARPIGVDPIVGKDILELLSSAMYLDPRAVFREYLQNSADAFDEAFATGVLDASSPGRVDVRIDLEQRSVTIRDNGTGIRSSDAERVLTAFGASGKRGTGARGFRGVGRLAAFGYAHTVSFRTKARGESQSTEVRWDCRRLKSALLDSAYGGDLRQLVRDVVTVSTTTEVDASAHYFEVVLDRVLRINNDILLNAVEISRYLGEVVPAPFADDFPFAAEIAVHLQPHVPAPRFSIYVNGSANPVTRPHHSEFALTTAKTDAFTEIERIVVPDGDGGLAAIGWIAHHGYLGAIHAADDLRGLRARVGDVQIGTGDVFIEAFKEPRFNSWTVGDLHVLDRRIVPNGRRDGFEQNAAFANVLAEVVLVARRQATKCRHSSNRRNRLRAFEARDKKIQDLFAILAQRNVSRAHQLKSKREIGAAFNEMTRLARSSFFTDEDQRRLRRRIASLEARYDGLKDLAEVADPFAEASTAERTAYARMVDLIYDCSANKAAARALVDRIMARLIAQAMRARRRRRR